VETSAAASDNNSSYTMAVPVAVVPVVAVQTLISHNFRQMLNSAPVTVLLCRCKEYAACGIDVMLAVAVAAPSVTPPTALH
jgi:hypothetical protein